MLPPGEVAVEQESPRLKLFLEDAEAVDALFQQALNRQGEDAFGEFLHFVRRFNRHSIFNALLILVQRPGAMAVGTRGQWRRLERTVNADAVPVIVLQPFGPIEFLYEVADTSGRPLPGETANPLLATGNVRPFHLERTVAAASKCGVRVEEVDIYGAGLAGTATRLPETEPVHARGPDAATFAGTEDGVRWRVRLNSRLNLASRFGTLAHELAHIYCGHLGRDPRDRWADRRRLTEDQRELEAEAAAWLVCERADLETRSDQYLATRITRENLRAISVFAILGAANRIEARSERLQPVGAKPKQRAGERRSRS